MYSLSLKNFNHHLCFISIFLSNAYALAISFSEFENNADYVTFAHVFYFYFFVPA